MKTIILRTTFILSILSLMVTLMWSLSNSHSLEVHADPINTTNSSQCTMMSLYLPITIKDSFEHEPNNNFIIANGPILPDVHYYGYPNDSDDFFFFDMKIGGSIFVTMTNFLAETGQLQLFEENTMVEIVTQPPYQLEYNGGKIGKRYYIRVFTASSFNSVTSYHLKASYLAPPSPPKSAPYILVEDFESSPPLTWWSPDPEVFNYIVATERYISEIHSFKIAFNKTDSYQFIAADLPNDLNDIRWAEAIEFWVHGESELLLKLEDALGNEEDIDLLIATEVNDWSLLRYSLQNVNGINLGNIKNLKIFPFPGDPNASGIIYIDELGLLETYGTLENFEYEQYLLWWTPDPDVFSYEIATHPSCDEQSLIVEYNKTNTYQFIGAETPPGLRDMSWAQSLQVQVFGHVTLLLSLEDENLVKYDLGTKVTDGPDRWTNLCFDLSSVNPGLNLSHIKNILFFPEPGNPSANGVFHLDDISLTTKLCNTIK